jgi:hypothetical protein
VLKPLNRALITIHEFDAPDFAGDNPDALTREDFNKCLMSRGGVAR